MSERKWHKGPPPHVGWWNASPVGDANMWCWWNGNNWSASVPNWENQDFAAELSGFPSKYNCTEILWRDHYPKNARVPRIDPRKA